MSKRFLSCLVCFLFCLFQASRSKQNRVGTIDRNDSFFSRFTPRTFLVRPAFGYIYLHSNMFIKSTRQLSYGLHKVLWSSLHEEIKDHLSLCSCNFFVSSICCSKKAEAKQNDAPNGIFAPREIVVWSDRGSRQVN